MKKLFTLLVAMSLAYMASACSAIFSTSISGASVTFTNTSVAPSHTGAMTRYANWDFGDASYASTWSTSHTYAAAGTYTVKLYVEWVDSASSTWVCDDTVIHYVTVSSTTGVSGSIFRDSSLGTVSMDSLWVWLITVDTGTHIITAVDSQSVAAYGAYSSYSFTGVTPGDYLVKAASMFGSSGSGFVPTYHTSSLHWNTADNVSVTSGSVSTANINMQYGTLTSGPGFIAGDVRYGAGKTTHVVGDPVAGLTIFVTNSTTGKLVSSGKTDAAGHYSIGVPYGTYNITPEQGGLVSTAWTSVTVTSATSSLHNNFKQNSTSIKPDVAAVPEVTTLSNISVYPNPAHGQVTIDWNGTTQKSVDITITNITGQKVIQTSLSINGANSKLNIAQLQPGVYFMNMHNSDLNYNNKLIIK